MIISDTIEKKAKCGCVVTSENEDEIVEFLIWFKNHIRKQPLYFTIDFKPGLDDAILRAFPKVKIIACTFHAVKLLVGGLAKELNRLQGVKHGIFIKECKKVRKMSLKLDKGKKVDNNVVLTHETCRQWYKFYLQIRGVCEEKDTAAFEMKYISMVGSITEWNGIIGCKLKESLPIKAGKGEFTKRSITGVKKALKTKWRAILLDLRKEMEEKKSQFARVKHILLKKPKNVKPWEMELMNEFFTANAWAQEIRKAVIQFYELFDEPSGKAQSFSFLDALITVDCHEQLRSSIETLNAKHEYIFNYLDAWKYKRAWNGIKSIKVNAEFINKQINSIRRMQIGFRSDESARYRLEQFLKCPIIYSRSFHVE